jgi:F-type H+-transporting ATPase subunit delta
MPAAIHTHPVTRVYARALLDLAGARADAIGAELAAVLALLAAEPRFRIFLETPALDAGTKKRALEAAFRGRADDLLVDFLCVVVEKQRLALLDEIGAAYRELADRGAGRLRVQVASATPLAAEEQHRLAATLRERLRSDIVLEPEVRPELLAGLVLQIGDRVYEASVRGWLQRLRKEMVRSSGYEG